ncbi:MAG: CdaR family protein [Erysipelotrichaceae bacterium]
MAKKKRSELSREGKTELAKSIAEKGQKFAKTYASIEISMAKSFRWLSSWIDKVLFSQKHGKIVALFLAILIYAVINVGNGSENVFISKSSAITLENIPVTATVSTEVYEVSGLPETVNVKVVGEASDIALVNSQKSTYGVVADLSDLSEGSHEVTLKPNNFSQRLDVIIEPSSVVVKISRKTTKVFNLGYDFVNTDKMDQIYSLSKPEFETSEVIVHASQETVDKIAFVKALIDVSGVDKTFERDAQIVAYDQKGNRVEVDILPTTMKTKVEVTTPTKNVPITIVPVGKIPNGKAITSVKLDTQALTIYGPESVLADINEIIIQLPASTFEGDKSVTMPIIAPNGVTKTSVQRVNIEVKLADSSERVISNVPVKYKNNKKGFKISSDEAAKFAEVKITGAKNILDEIKIEDLEVYFDLGKVNEAGSMELPLSVKGKQKLANYSLSKATIRVTLVNPN